MKIHLDEVLDSETIQNSLKEQALAYVQDAVTTELQYALRESVKKMINENIEKEVVAALSAEVVIDDGWGKKTRYESFFDLYRQTLKKALDSYNIKSEAQRVVTTQVTTLLSQHLNTLQKTLTGMVK